jgi:hypothetical protein
MLRVARSTSTKTGTAPVSFTATTGGIPTLATVMTSSPAPTPSAWSAILMASVPLATPMPCFASQ